MRTHWTQLAPSLHAFVYWNFFYLALADDVFDLLTQATNESKSFLDLNKIISSIHWQM